MTYSYEIQFTGLLPVLLLLLVIILLEQLLLVLFQRQFQLEQLLIGRERLLIGQEQLLIVLLVLVQQLQLALVVIILLQLELKPILALQHLVLKPLVEPQVVHQLKAFIIRVVVINTLIHLLYYHFYVAV